jgi:hypothetical protein
VIWRASLLAGIRTPAIESDSELVMVIAFSHQKI